MRVAIAWLLVTFILTESVRSQQAIDSVVDRMVAARGGRERVLAVRTERLVGRITFPDGTTGVDTVEIARPVRIRTSIHVGDRVLVQAYDGHTAWELNGFQGDTIPHVLDPGTARNVIAGADMDGPLVDYAAKGYRLELAGRDTADGRPAYAIRVLRPDSLEDTYFIDAASFLQTKWQGHRTVNGTAIVFETYFRDYRTVDGLQVPFRLDSGTLGRSGVVHFEFDTIAVDVPIADDRFAMP